MKRLPSDILREKNARANQIRREIGPQIGSPYRIHEETQRRLRKPKAIVPPNCELVNGHLVCRNDEGLYDLFTAGEGWWGFNLTKERALTTANTVSPEKQAKA